MREKYNHNFIRKIFYMKDVQFQDTYENKKRFLRFCKSEGYQWVNYMDSYIPENPIQVSRLLDDKVLTNYPDRNYESIDLKEFLRKINILAKQVK